MAIAVSEARECSDGSLSGHEITFVIPRATSSHCCLTHPKTRMGSVRVFILGVACMQTCTFLNIQSNVTSSGHVSVEHTYGSKMSDLLVLQYEADSSCRLSLIMGSAAVVPFYLEIFLRGLTVCSDAPQVAHGLHCFLFPVRTCNTSAWLKVRHENHTDSYTYLALALIGN